jgi:hypothetical protein
LTKRKIQGRREIAIYMEKDKEKWREGEREMERWRKRNGEMEKEKWRDGVREIQI